MKPIVGAAWTRRQAPRSQSGACAGAPPVTERSCVRNAEDVEMRPARHVTLLQLLALVLRVRLELVHPVPHLAELAPESDALALGGVLEDLAADEGTRAFDQRPQRRDHASIVTLGVDLHEAQPLGFARKLALHVAWQVPAFHPQLEEVRMRPFADPLVEPAVAVARVRILEHQLSVFRDGGE